jgi:nitroreductase
MDSLDLLLRRHSTPSRLLGEPGPDPAQLQALLRAAVHVPDHGRLAPWRFIAVRGEQRARLGEVLARRTLERDPAAPAAVVEKDRQRFGHAPLVLVVVARTTVPHKIPEQEQLLSGGAACFSVLLAADAMGFGAQWLTGWAAYDPVVAAALGLSAGERVLGFLHIGSVAEPVPDRERPDPASLLTDLSL